MLEYCCYRRALFVGALCCVGLVGGCRALVGYPSSPEADGGVDLSGSDGKLVDGPHLELGTRDGAVDGAAADGDASDAEGGVAPDGPSPDLDPAQFNKSPPTSWLSWGLQRKAGATCSERGHNGCLHTGVVHLAALRTKASCHEVEIRDALDVFRWRCTQQGQTLLIESYGLKPGKGLAHLLDKRGWLLNRIEVRISGTLVAHTPDETWFTDPVANLPPASGVTGVITLGTPGTIYVEDQQRSVSGVDITAHRVGLVVLDGGLLKHDGSHQQLCGSRRCLLALRYPLENIWLEGAFDGGGQADYTVWIEDARFSSLHRIRLADGVEEDLRMLNLQNSELTHLRQQNPETFIGVRLVQGDYNRWYDIGVAGNKTVGLAIGSTSGGTAHHHRMYQVVAQGNSAAQTGTFGGVLLDCSTKYITAVRAIALGNSHGWLDICGVEHTVSHITAVGNRNFGVAGDETGPHRWAQVLAMGNGAGLQLNASHMIVSQAALENADWEIYSAAKGSVLHGQLILGSGQGIPCSIEGSAVGYLASGTCTESGGEGSSDYPSGSSSTATLRKGRDFSDALLGHVTSDQTCDFDQDGVAATIKDWWRTDHLFRLFGKNGLYPSARGRCDGNCRIWDLRLDPKGKAIWGRSNDGVNEVMAIPGQDCPSSVSGPTQLTMNDPTRYEKLGSGGNGDGHCDDATEICEDSTFLVNAQEIVGDAIGDDDGLCESNEHCTYSPHFGAWQGEGDLTGRTCTFADGVVEGVTMYIFPN